MRLLVGEVETMVNSGSEEQLVQSQSDLKLSLRPYRLRRREGCAEATACGGGCTMFRQRCVSTAEERKVLALSRHRRSLLTQTNVFFSGWYWQSCEVSMEVFIQSW
jgi:hypothetical protein